MRRRRLIGTGIAGAWSGHSNAQSLMHEATLLVVSQPEYVRLRTVLVPYVGGRTDRRPLHRLSPVVSACCSTSVRFARQCCLPAVPGGVVSTQALQARGEPTTIRHPSTLASRPRGPGPAELTIGRCRVQADHRTYIWLKTRRDTTIHWPDGVEACCSQP